MKKDMIDEPMTNELDIKKLIYPRKQANQSAHIKKSKREVRMCMSK